MAIEEFIAGFTEEPGYLDYGRVGPLSEAVVAEVMANTDAVRRARPGGLDAMYSEPDRLRAAVESVIGFPAGNVVVQPNTSTGLMQALFGVSGDVLLSPHEYPSLTYAAVRASEALHSGEPIWLETTDGRVTPADVRAQITAGTAAVAVSLVDYRTGHVADLEGIRQMIGDRLLIVDAIQGLGVVDAPYETADVVASGGQKWLRAGWGTGFLALSDHALERLTPVLSGYPGAEEATVDEVVAPDRSARAFSVSTEDYAAAARMAAALEEVAAVGVAEVAKAVGERAAAVIALADEFGVPVSSPREEERRAGIVTLRPDAVDVTALAAAFHNVGARVTTRSGTVRVSVHAGTSTETLGMARQALVAFAAGR